MSVSAENCDYGGEFLSIEAIDELTVKFTLCFPDPAFPAKVAFSSFTIHPSEHLEATGGGGPALVQHPVGTGPYMLSNWELGSEIVLSRYDGYWGEPAKEPTVIFRWNPEGAARLIELQAGNVDGIDNVGTGDIEVVRNDPNLALYDRAGLNVLYVGMNNWYKPFDNPKVRQAVAYAIDRQRIVDNFTPAGSIVATDFMPPAIFGHTPEVEPFPYDPDMARQLLAEAAAESGFELPLDSVINPDGSEAPLTLSYRDPARGYWALTTQITQDVQAQLAEVGIVAQINLVESTVYLDQSDSGAFPLYMLGWGADYTDATNFLDYHFGSASSDQFGDQLPEVTDPLSRAARLADPDERYPIYVEANTALRDLAPMVPISHSASAVAFTADIVGAHASPLTNEQLALMEDPDDDNIIFMQNGEPGGLYCADESDGEALRVCDQINEALLGYEVAGTAVVPSLASEYSANEDATEWTFTLREGVTFHDGSALDANDVVLSYVVQWDASHPLHVGRDGSFTYLGGFFGSFLNAPSE